MDELAVALDMDPVLLRIKNEPLVGPQDGKPFSTRHLVPCLEKGAELFGWNRWGMVGGSGHVSRNPR
jgi:xanthine dehydrogenase YagR molybdenum-binding subunit